MKKNLILTIALGLFLFSCTKSDMLPEPKASTSVSATKLTPPEPTCSNYSIFNPHGPTGASVYYVFTDCSGTPQSGWIDPLVTIYIKAIPGTVKCLGGVITAI